MLQFLNKLVETKRNHAQDNQCGNQIVEPEYLTGVDDEIAQSFSGGEKFTDDDTYQAKSDTGYVRGGCTAIGMKKQFVTRIAAAAENLDKIIVSGGRIGSQLELKPEDLKKACKGEFADITV